MSGVGPKLTLVASRRDVRFQFEADANVEAGK
jgi:hypothetical protein